MEEVSPCTHLLWRGSCGGSALTRLLSTKFTAGTGNPVVSTGEGLAATGFSLLSLVAPFWRLYY